MITNKIMQEKAVETADKISTFSDNMPNILRIIFEEDVNRMREQSQDELEVLKQYETRAINTTYSQVIQNAAKTQLKALLKKNEKR